MSRRLICLVLVAAMSPLVACQARSAEATNTEVADAVADAPTEATTGGLFEVRNYHYRPDLLDAYRSWAENEAIPYLGRHVDIIGFWIGTDVPAQISGEPLDDLGSANVTWIIRWDDMEQRTERMAATFATEEWADIYSRVPGGRESYLRIEARFMEPARR